MTPSTSSTTALGRPFGQWPVQLGRSAGESGFDKPDQVMPSLLAEAPLLGLSPEDLGLTTPEATTAAGTRLPTGRVINGFIKGWLSGRSTPVYDVAVECDLSIGQPGNFAAKLIYVFTYH